VGKLGLFNLQKRRLEEDLIAALQYLQGSYHKDSQVLDSATWREEQENAYKLKQDWFSLDRSKSFSPHEWASRGTGCPELLCRLCPWRFSRLNCIKHGAT